MDYDDEYDQAQQYEDELYKDSSDKSESSDEVDSEIEDTILSHIHYSTNVYKKAGTTPITPAGDQESNDTFLDSTDIPGPTTPSSVPPNGYLAVTPTAAEDYFRAVNQGTELDSESEEGLIKGAKKASATTAGAGIIGSKASDHKRPVEDEEESRYSVERKKEIPKNTWSQHAESPQGPADESAGTDSEGSEAEQSIGSASINEISDDDETEGAPQLKKMRLIDDAEGLNEHVLDLGASMKDLEDEANNYDLDTELGHLEDEKFKGHSRYYMGPKDQKSKSLIVCHRCDKVGHIGRDCTTVVCNVCGAKDEHATKDCPHSICYNCRKKGHVAINCPYERGYAFKNYCRTCGSKEHATEVYTASC
ncbi:hypothetical protein BC939DRAFT_90844 [Gamsiella multidivaricata]|uniref:uncharacterized protein n=1 Tax=Gamsiella multidivaricata TaxID=101098 RepID=UPI0022208B1C|nr:uncharacterized protein BC939DRAFT_90844 [Gamsiella multidivaricata]KAI7827479.1 hypothetical protein BC939DRAFT_90844 [Gamsiella multidivaricata]